MFKFLLIRLGQQGDLELRFRIKNSPIAELWVDRMLQRTAWPLDHPDRFYGFGTPAEERKRAVDTIQQCIDAINAHQVIINRPFEYTQDCLNYLHNIFERYHGLLDQQNSDYWNNAPESVRKALAELNLAVHRCESVAAGAQPRFVCTWFGMPKVHRLASDLQGMYGDWRIKFGTVYLNYCEIGKTVEDLAHDNDKYIGDDAFRPFSHYSADFNVAFYDRDLTNIYGRVQRYIDEHQDFFVAHSIKSVYNIKAQPLRFPVAELEYQGARDSLLFEIAQRQWVQQVLLE
jgi:hypothetical protein